MIDIHLPGMSGLDLQSRLQSNGWVRTPLILTTAHAAVGARVRAQQRGPVLLKPFPGELLLTTIESLARSTER